jgi:hypothetical protein
MELDQRRPQPSRLQRVPRWPAQAFVVVLAVGLAARFWQLVGRRPLWWGDSDDYLATSRSSLFSLDLWAGDRPAAVPLLLKVAGGNDMRFVAAQVGIAALCWAALAASVATVLPVTRRAWVAVGAIAALSVAYPVAMWERSVLSESLAMSCLVLVVAAGIQLARGVTSWRSAAFLAALAAWLVTRDSHSSVALAVGVGFAGWYAFGRSRFQPERAVLAAGVVVLALMASVSAAYGHRYSFPLRNVFAARILPYPERVDWFADHGMPQAEEFAEPVAAEPGQPPVRWIGEDDPVMQPWVDWVDSDGRSTFLRWMITHPGYVLAEPWRNPERTFNDADGDRSFYAPLDMREMPLVTGLLFPAQVVALAAGLVALWWAIDRDRWRSPVFVVGATAVVLAAPHALISWHSDAMEAARHLVVPVVQLHLGVLLMVVGAWLGGPRSTSATSRADLV